MIFQAAVLILLFGIWLNTWHLTRKALGKHNPNLWRFLWWAFADQINRRRPGTL